MNNSSIINLTPGFIDYCDKEKKLSPKTLENYKRFLEKFFYWLRKNGKEGMKPDELALDDINSYRLFLADNTINLNKYPELLFNRPKVLFGLLFR